MFTGLPLRAGGFFYDRGNKMMVMFNNNDKFVKK
jgi:hypothetical protein